ncbi:MAG: glycosyltransferase, partial [Kineosporiaceae bacterium]
MTPAGRIHEAVARYVEDVAGAARAALDNELVGVYAYGSAAGDAFVPGRSDVDVMVVVRQQPGDGVLDELLGQVRRVRRPWAARGLDLCVVPEAQARSGSAAPRLAAWILTSIDSEIRDGPGSEGDARLVLLFALCRSQGVALAGPDPAEVFPEQGAEAVADAMRVDLGLTGAAAWYTVLNSCRTLHYLDTGSMCDRDTGARWARGRLADHDLIDAALAWHRTGSGPPMPPDRVARFIRPVLDELAVRVGTATPLGVPVVEASPRVRVLADTAVVSCVMRAPATADLLAFAVRSFAAQDWPHRELVLVGPGVSGVLAWLSPEVDVRPVALPAGEENEWRGYGLAAASGPVVATWDATTWYARDRLTQQVRELMSTSAPRVAAASLLVHDPRSRETRRVRDAGLLRRSTLCARRDAWDVDGAVRLGERGDLAVLMGPVLGGDPATPGEAESVATEAFEAFRTAALTASARVVWEPAVSCLMPTYNRRRFAVRAVEYFLRQDHPNRQLVVLDDSRQSMAGALPDDPRVTYRRLEERASIGRKRQLLAEAADGDVLVQWDDDDWYGPSRLSRQVAPLAAGAADITGVVGGHLLDVPSFRFFETGPPLHEGRLHAFIIAGTLALTRSAWLSAGGYPDVSIGEEVSVLRAVSERGGRVASVTNDGLFVQVRHGGNSWHLPHDPAKDRSRRAETPPPAFMAPADVDFYRQL